MKRRSLITSGGALALASVLPGCGSGSSASQGKLRLVNASVSYATLGMTVDSNTPYTPVAYANASSYNAYNAGAVTTAVTDGATGNVVATQSRSIQGNNTYTLVAYGWASAVKTFQLNDNETAPASGSVKFRALNCASDAGTLSVYVTSDTTDLATATPTITAVIGDTVSSYATITAGTYRVRVTALGNPDDVRLDVSGVSLPSAGMITLVVTSGASGVLVRGILMEQGGNLTSLSSNRARVRVVASVSSNATVDATVGSSALLTGVRSPTIGNYQSLPSGSLPVTVLVNGKAVAVPNLDAVAGSDYTLLVTGTPAAPTVQVIAENNRLPLLATNCRIRMVHAASTLANSGMALTVNYTATATNVAYGTASTYVEVPAVASAVVEVTNPLALSSVYSISGVALVANALYTVFVVMGTDGPRGVLLRER